MNEEDWACEMCGRNRLEALFRMWINNKEIVCCSTCRGNQVINCRDFKIPYTPVGKTAVKKE